MTQKSIFCPSKVSKTYEKAKVFNGKTLLSLIFPDKLLAENQYKLFNLSEPHANLLQLCSIPCDPMDCSPPGSSVHGILQARTLELLCPSPGILPTQGSNPRLLRLLHWQEGYRQCHLGSPLSLSFLKYKIKILCVSVLMCQ